jgi:transcriptional regulator with XRE-family HTH domain
MNNGQFLKVMGVKIKAARRSRKITLMQLSKSCGVNITALSFLENGKSNPHLLTIKSIADVLKMDVKDFI